MASSKSRKDIDALVTKLHAALSLFDFCQPDANGSAQDAPAFAEMEIANLKEIWNDPGAFQSDTEFIASEFRYHDKIKKSKLLADKDLFKAVMFSKVFNEEAEFLENHHKYKDESVWLTEHMDSSITFLVSGNKIIYRIDSNTLREIRSEMQKTWDIFRVRVEENLVKVLSWWVGTRDGSQSVLQPPSNVSPWCWWMCDLVTDDIKIAILEELHGLNLDVHVKSQFTFDLKMLGNREVLYWGDRLDSLQRYSKRAEVNPLESSERRLSGASAKLGEKIDILISIVDQLKFKNITGFKFGREHLAEQLEQASQMPISEMHERCESPSQQMDDLGKSLSSVIKDLLAFLLKAD